MNRKCLLVANGDLRLSANRKCWAAQGAVEKDVIAALEKEEVRATRDQMMGRHKANHIQVAYAKDSASANQALAVKVAMLQAMGIEVHVCGANHGLR